jgi:hypothetical protein
MKWIWYEYEGDGRSFLQHVPSEKPTENPTTGPPHFRVMVWYGVAPLRPPTTYKVCQTPFLCMKWIWYEYEVDGRAQSYPTACPQWESHWSSLTVPLSSQSMDMTIRYAKVHLIYDLWLSIILYYDESSIVAACTCSHLSCTCIQDNSPWCRRWVSVGSYNWGPPSAS